MGTPQFAVPSLEILIQHGYDVAAVVTGPDRPRGRGLEVSPTPVKEVAVRHQLPTLQPENLDDPAFVEELRGLAPDLGIVVAFRILPEAVFMLPRLGTFNLHASLLPKYRGAAPINWSLMNGERETGVTTFFLEERVDTGKTILQLRETISPDDDAGTLHDRLALLGAEAVLSTVRQIEQGKAIPVPQDNALASRAPKIRKEDCRIRWDDRAECIHNRIRGLSPVPGAFALHGGHPLKIFRSEVLAIPSAQEPGTLEVTKAGICVHTRDRLLSVLEVQQEGKKRMGIAEFLRGYRIASGEKLT